MAAVQTKNSASPVILFAIIGLGLMAGYFYYAQAVPGNIPQIESLDIQSENDLAKFKNMQFDFRPFDDFKFKSLRIFGESPVQPGVTGRVDIFAPF